MSTVPQYSVVLPSAETLTIATEVVGEITALSATANPRPRRTAPVPRSNGLLPIEPLGDAVEDFLDRGVLQDRTGGLRAAVAQQVLLAEFERIALERARDHVGVALIGPHQLRNTEAAQGAGRRQVGIERIGIDRDIVDVVWARSGEAGFLRHARADICIGAAVPPHLAFARDDAAVLVETAFDAERARMFGDRVEMLFHRMRDLYRSARQHRHRGRERLQFDVELAAVAAAEIRHFDAHTVLRPAKQTRNLGAHERRTLCR